MDIDLRPTNGPNAADRSIHGSPSRPLSIASTASIDYSGAITAYGMFYAASSTADANYISPGNGGATVYGSIITRGNFLKGTGNMRVIYDANLFNPQNQPMLLVRVPGSWRDSLNEL